MSIGGGLSHLVRRRLPRSAIGVLVGLLASLAAPVQALARPVDVYPFPGTHYNLPRSQIVFRGIAPTEIGQVRVVGSASGPHTGALEPDSDDRGASFVPATPFKAGEKVTVSTHLDLQGAPKGTYSFTIEQPSRPIQPTALPVIPAGRNGLQHFRTQPDLLPPSVVFNRSSAPASEGDIFLAPQFGPVQDGPMILDPGGKLIWFDPFQVSRKILITDFRVQQLLGQPVLTWWQGTTNHGSGRGVGIVLNNHYQLIHIVHAGNGLDMDLHEFLLTPQGTAWVIAVSPVGIPGIHKPVMDAVVQEIDIPTGLVMFEWHALDHVRLADSDFTPNSPGYIFDPYHLNSVGVDHDGNLVFSMRNTSAIYKVNRDTGAVLWELGGKQSSFKMGPGTSTAFQHSAIVEPDGTITVFDDGAGPPAVHQYSRGIRVAIDTKAKVARLVTQYNHSPPISAAFEGNVQQLSDGNVFLGWGQQPYFSEYNSSGRQIFDGHFTVPTSSYRAYRFTWSAQPASNPAATLTTNADGSSDLYASWNGATGVSRWQVLAGSDPSSLSDFGASAKQGFETHIELHSAAPYFAVQALGPSGNVLASSPPITVGAHLALFGRNAFVSTAGTGSIPAGCYATTSCALSATIAVGRTVIARTGPEQVAQNGGGLVYFTLSSSGRSMLAHARGGRLPVTTSITNGAGQRASAAMQLIAFGTSGPGPARSVSQSPTLQLVGMTDFVSSAGTGGVLVACAAPTPCHVKATVADGGPTGPVIAAAGPEFIGAGELGYVVFHLSATGLSLLAHAPGNQLGVSVTVNSETSTASGQLALVRFR